MVIRLLLVAVGLGTVWYLWRNRRAFFEMIVRALHKPPAPPPPPPPLGSDEVEDLKALAAGAEGGRLLGEALELWGRIGELASADPSTDAELAARIDGVLRELGRQVRTRHRVAATLADFDEGRMEIEMMTARQRLRGAPVDDSEAKEQAKQTLDRLQSQQALLDRLHVRMSELDQASADTTLELRNVHLALLDAASSRAGLRGEKLREIRVALGRASDDVTLRTDAEEAVERLLRGHDPEE